MGRCTNQPSARAGDENRGQKRSTHLELAQLRGSEALHGPQLEARRGVRALESQQLTVVLQQRRAVADRDDGQPGHARERAVHGRLVGQVEGGGILVQDGQPRPVDQQAGEGEPLLLAQAEHAAPVAHRVEPIAAALGRRQPVRQRSELHRVQRAPQRAPRHARRGLGRQGVEQLLAQAVDGAVRPLRRDGDGMQAEIARELGGRGVAPAARRARARAAGAR